MNPRPTPKTTARSVTRLSPLGSAARDLRLSAEAFLSEAQKRGAVPTQTRRVLTHAALCAAIVERTETYSVITGNPTPSTPRTTTTTKGSKRTTYTLLNGGGDSGGGEAA